MMRALAALLGVVLVSSAVAESSAGADRRGQSFWDRDIWQERDRGFLFYQPDDDPKPPRRRSDPEPAKPTRKLEQLDHDELKAERERRLKVAVMQPTPQNMSAYLEVNTLILRKSALFADMWRRTVWSNPQYDFNVQNPQPNFAQTQIRLDREAGKRTTMHELAHEFGIVFFYRGDCPYCKLQAPVLRALSSTFGMNVLAVSLDGQPLEGFPDARPDNGISLTVTEGRGVDHVPALYLVSRSTKQFVMLGAGVMAMSDIVERVHVLTQQQPGEDVAGGLR